MRLMMAGLIGLGAAALAACETIGGPAMSPAQCSVADWKALGYQDGAEGRVPERFVSRQQACIAVGYGADQEAYMAGRRDGLWTWCQPDRAFRLGLDGNSYNGVCPPELDGMFRDAHAEGYRAHTVVSALQSVESTITSLRSERDDLEHKIQANQLGLERSATEEERQRHRGELDRLYGERRQVENRLHDAERDRRYRARDVSELREELGFRFGSW
ncbi:MAG: DUF2799 domain-containing protein [Hyphomonadaceae bacterium]|nr:DUF2799 domain-containing protein [Hyphomonadaceae bacterium]